MKKTVLNLLVILVVVGITFGATRQWFPNTVDNTVTDTVFVDKPFTIEPVKPQDKMIPATVTMWEIEYSSLEKIELVDDTVKVYRDSTQMPLLYNSRYLVNYPQAPKFLNLRTTQGQAELTYLKTTGQTQSQTWNVGRKNYRIGLNNGEPTLETLDNPTEFSWSVEAGMLRYFNDVKWSPYLEGSATFSIFNLDVTTTANINQVPFVTTGVKHEF